MADDLIFVALSGSERAAFDELLATHRLQVGLLYDDESVPVFGIGPADQPPADGNPTNCPCLKSMCDHVWCERHQQWANDTGNGPSCL